MKFLPMSGWSVVLACLVGLPLRAAVTHEDSLLAQKLVNQLSFLAPHLEKGESAVFERYMETSNDLLQLATRLASASVHEENTKETLIHLVLITHVRAQSINHGVLKAAAMNRRQIEMLRDLRKDLMEDRLAWVREEGVKNSDLLAHTITLCRLSSSEWKEKLSESIKEAVDKNVADAILKSDDTLRLNGKDTASLKALRVRLERLVNLGNAMGVRLLDSKEIKVDKTTLLSMRKRFYKALDDKPIPLLESY